MKDEHTIHEWRQLVDLTVQDGLPVAIWFKPKLTMDDGTESPECLNIEFAWGPKRFLRLWPTTETVDWGWAVHESSVLLWSAEGNTIAHYPHREAITSTPRHESEGKIRDADVD